MKKKVIVLGIIIVVMLINIMNAYAVVDYRNAYSSIKNSSYSSIILQTKKQPTLGHFSPNSASQQQNILDIIKKNGIPADVSKYSANEAKNSKAYFITLDVIPKSSWAPVGGCYSVILDKTHADQLITIINDNNKKAVDLDAVKNQINNDSSNIIERMIATAIGVPVIAILTLVNRLAGFKSYSELLYNYPDITTDTTKAVQEKLLNAPIDGSLWAVMDKVYFYIALLVTCLYLLAVVVLAIKMISAGYNPRARESIKETFSRLIMSALIIVLTPVLFHVLLFINNELVYALTKIMSDTPLSVDGHLNLNNFISNIKTGSAIADVVVIVLFAFIEIKINLLFIVREFSVVIFYIFTPIAAVMWSLDKSVNAIGVWMGELLSNVFMQFFYALVFMVYIMVTKSATWTTSIIWALCLLPIAEALRNTVQGYMTKLSGVDEGRVANTALGLIGLGGAAHTASAVASQFKGGTHIPTDLTGNGGGESPTGNTASASSFSGGTASGELMAMSKTIKDDKKPLGADTMIKSLKTGSRADDIVGGITDPIAKASGVIGNTVLPGASKATNFASRALKGTANFAAGTVSAIVNAKKYAKENSIGYGEALKQMTGGKNAVRAAGRAISLNMSNAFGNPEKKLKKYNIGIDGPRWK